MRILETMLESLFVAWILSLFGVDQMLLSAVQPMVHQHLIEGDYYSAFILLGLVGGVFRL